MPNDPTYMVGMTAVSIDGALLWHYVPGGSHGRVLSEPAIGSDGNLYLAESSSTVGSHVVSLDSAGNTRWSAPSAWSFDYSTEVGFTSTNLVLVYPFGVPLQAFSQAGTWLWESWDFFNNPTEPFSVDEDDQVIGAGGTGIIAVSEAGNSLWVNLSAGASLKLPRLTDSGDILVSSYHTDWAAIPPDDVRFSSPPTCSSYPALKLVPLGANKPVTWSLWWGYGAALDWDGGFFALQWQTINECNETGHTELVHLGGAGNELWSRDLGYVPIDMDLSVDGGGMVIAAGPVTPSAYIPSSPCLFAYDSDGNLEWTWDCGQGASASAPIIGPGRRLYFTSKLPDGSSWLVCLGEQDLDDLRTRPKETPQN